MQPEKIAASWEPVRSVGTGLASLACAFLLVACGSPAADQPIDTAPDPGAAAPAVSHDPTLYGEYEWPGDWAPALDESGAAMHDAYVAKRDGDRQVVVSDSASALFGHEGKLRRSVLVIGSHCGKNTAQLYVRTKPLAVIGHDAGVGLHAAGIQCIPLGDESGLPVATVSTDTAYIGVGMSLWQTGRISVVNKSAEALGVRVGMSTQEAASILLANAKMPSSL